MALTDTLTKKIGPLPTWAYLVIAAGGIYLYIRHRNAAAAASTTAATPVASDASGPTAADNSSGLSALPDATGGVSGGSSGGVSGGTLDTGGSGFSTGPTATGYTDAYGNPISADAYSQQQQSQNAAQILGFIEALASEGLQYDAATGEVIPIGSGTTSGSPPTVGTTTPPPTDVGTSAPLPSPLPPSPPTPINTNTSSPAAHEPTAGAVNSGAGGLALRYGASYSGTAAQSNVVKSFLKRHYTGTALNDNLRRVASDRNYASSVYAAALRNG